MTVKQPEEETSTGDNTDSNMYVALFPYSSEEPGDLQFEAGEKIEVVKKESEWWTGKIGDRMGVFPYNYVEAAPPEPKVSFNFYLVKINDTVFLKVLWQCFNHMGLALLLFY